jgi:tape measure domain-containing protein
MAATANLKSTISLDATAFSAGVRKVRMSASATAKSVRASFQKIGGIIAKVATIASAITFSAAVVGVGKLVAASSKMASSYEGISVRMTAFLGDANKARAVLDKISAFSVVTPFETRGLQEATNKLLGAGIAGDEVVDVLKEIAAVSSDTEQVGELSDAMAKGFAKGKFQTEELNKFLERGINLMPELEKNTGLTGEALQKAIQKGLKFEDVRKALAGLSAEGGLFEGMLKKQSVTFAGLISTLSSNWDEFKTKFGEPINNALKPLLEFGIKKIQELTTMAGKLGEGLAIAITKITTALNSTLGKLDFSQLGPQFLAGLDVDGAKTVLLLMLKVVAAFMGNQLVKTIKMAATLAEIAFNFVLKKVTEKWGDDLKKTLLAVASIATKPVWVQVRELKKLLNSQAEDSGETLGDKMAQGMKDFAEKMKSDEDPFGLNDALKNLRTSLSDIVDKGKEELNDAAGNQGGNGKSATDRNGAIRKDSLKGDRLQKTFGSPGDDFVGPSRDLMNKPAVHISPHIALKKNPALMGAFDKLQAQKAAGIGVGTATSFAKDRERLGIASGLRTGGIGDVKAVGAKAGAAIAKKDGTVETTNDRLGEQIDLMKEEVSLLREGLSA